MSDIKPFPESISHKNLKIFLSDAPKEKKDIEGLAKSKEHFNGFLENWLTSSEELITHLRQNENYLTNQKGKNSILALGAMEAHINMAMQALKSYKSESEE